MAYFGHMGVAGAKWNSVEKIVKGGKFWKSACSRLCAGRPKITIFGNGKGKKKSEHRAHSMLAKRQAYR
jgi:hypothetical protein